MSPEKKSKIINILVQTFVALLTALTGVFAGCQLA